MISEGISNLEHSFIRCKNVIQQATQSNLQARKRGVCVHIRNNKNVGEPILILNLNFHHTHTHTKEEEEKKKDESWLQQHQKKGEICLMK